MQPWPIAYSHLQTNPQRPPLRVAILEVAPAEPAGDPLQPGQIVGGKKLIVSIGDGAMEICRIRPAGKREMTGEEFARGYQLASGTRFESV